MPTSKSTVITIGVLTLFLALAAWFTYNQLFKRTPPQETPAGQALFGAGAASYTDIDGSTVTLESFFGQPILINTWASWSPLSAQELQDLNTVASEYQDRGVTIIALNRKESKDQADRFLNTLPPLDSLRIIIDTTDQFYNAVAGYAMPETVVYDRNGELLFHERNPQTKENLRALLDQALLIE